MNSNLSRVTAKIFAGDAPTSAVGQFGSALNGTKVNTTDISTIQDLKAYEQGWSSAVVTNRNYPTLEEMNGVMKIMSYQTAYNMQKGVAEWDEGTVYFSGDICKAVGVGTLYVSRSDYNIGNPLTDATYWREYQGSASLIPATNYIAEINGNATFSNNTITLPEMTLYIPNGRSGNGTLNNIIENVPSATYTVSGNGDYTLFYDNSNKNLLLAPNYETRLLQLPETGNYDDVAYLLDNKMYVVESTNPNYDISNGATVSSSGVVSNLGTLSVKFNAQIPPLPILNLNFTTGADITTSQNLFSLPYAEGNISNGNLDIVINSLAYGVNYFAQVYSGTYSLINQAVTYSYLINNTTYYTKTPIQVGLSVYEDVQFNTLYGKVTSIDDSTVTIQNNNEDVYNGTYTDTSTRIYTYTLGENTVYSSGVLIPGLTVYINSELTIPYGVVENITTQNVVIHSTQSSVGYIAVSGSGAVPANNPIYSDVNLQNEVATTTGANATFIGSSTISQVGSLTYELTASTNYSGTLSCNGASYTLVLNNISTALLSSRIPYTESSPEMILGGEKGFLGTISLSGTSLENIWSWNGYNTITPDWTVEQLCKIGSITMSNNEVTELNLDTAIELVKMSDLDVLNIKGNDSGLEIGDIGLAFNVDETKGLRRVLNGSVVAINTNTQGFLTYLKNLQSQKPELFTTEENWQAQAKLNPEGLVNKFVLDEEQGTIRLPKYPKYILANSDALTTTAPVVGNGIALGLTDGTNNLGVIRAGASDNDLGVGVSAYGQPIGQSTTLPGIPGSNVILGITKDPTKSGLVADLSSFVKSNVKLELSYFIQIATGATQEVNIANEIELNNPFFFGMYAYFEIEPNNVSWLKSLGQWNNGKFYQSYFDWILENVNKGTKNFKSNMAYAFNGSINCWFPVEKPVVGAWAYSTTNGEPIGQVEQVNDNGSLVINGNTVTFTGGSEADSSLFTDYDFIINLKNETFRLPLKTHIAPLGDTAPATGNGMSLGLTDGITNAGLFWTSGANGGHTVSSTTSYGKEVGVSDSWTTTNLGSNKVVGVTTDPDKSGLIAVLSLSNNKNAYLYFYVGETVQNANLIDAGRMQEQLANVESKINNIESSLVGNFKAGSNTAIVSDLTVSNTNQTIDLSSIIPKDDKNYLCNILIEGKSSQAGIALTVTGAFGTTARVRSSETSYLNDISTWIAVNKNRTINIRATNNTFTSVVVYLYSYIQIGNNSLEV